MAALHNKTLAVETGVFVTITVYFVTRRAIDTYLNIKTGFQRGNYFPHAVGIANGFDEVSLTGGEPSIRPDFGTGPSGS